jgi:hypothetical protein
MRRRDISTLLFGTAAAAAPSSARPAAQTYAAPCCAQTAAEASAKVVPKSMEYQEGDIRRYGASVAEPDNSDAINAALLVSAHHGNPAFIPGGVWKIASTLRATQSCSMCGVGNASIIAPQECDGITFETSGNYAVIGLSRFFRDFQLVGSNAADSTHRGLVVNFVAASTDRVNAVQFENLFIANFGTGAHLRGLWFSNFVGCHFYNCYYGIYFIGQNCVNTILNCSFDRATIRGLGGAWGISFQTIDGETTQSTNVIAGSIYFYDICIHVALAFDLKMEHCDLSAAQSIGAYIISTIGGCWLRDCWIETDNASATIGIKVADIQPSTYTSVHITGNHINCDIPHAGSQGILVGNNNAGIVINDNAVMGFDQAITLGASAYAVCKFNRIKCVTPAYSRASHALHLNSLATDDEIGPNEIIGGEKQATRMSTGDPRISVSAAASFPVGTPVQFDADVNGFAHGVTYFVLSSESNIITVGPTAKGPAISATGTSALNLCAAPLPLTFTGSTPRGLSFFGRGSFVMSLLGFTAAVSGIVEWVTSGKVVVLSARAPLTGISNTAAMSASGIPAFLWPATTQQLLANVQDEGAFTCGIARLSSSGELTFFKTPNLDVFTASKSKGLNALPLTYIYS